MPLVYLVLLVAMMFVGGMLITFNPSPVTFNVGWQGQTFAVTASVLELIGGSMVGGALFAVMLTLRGQLLSGRDRRRAEREAERLREESTVLRRETENARGQAALLSAQLAEVREAYAALEAESRPLLTMRAEEPPAVAPAAARPTVYPKRRAGTDETKRARSPKANGKPRPRRS
ncbi:MAG: hypothetical protein HZB16_01450 [Armatimonadetes bacterium]|nr:hypothetical protein [Armatimonadota bacterium]